MELREPAPIAAPPAPAAAPRQAEPQPAPAEDDNPFDIMGNLFAWTRKTPPT